MVFRFSQIIVKISCVMSRESSGDFNKKLQKEYLIRLNREGIPIRRIGTSKYTFKELRDLINSDPENDNIENDIRIKKYYLSLRRKGYKIEDIIEKMRDRRNYENYKDYKNYKKNYRKNTKIIKEMVF